jgi:hypothetical protein
MQQINNSMKTSKKGLICATLLTGAALLGAATQARAQTVTSSITNNFDVANSASGWTYWYDLYQTLGYNVVILDWDGTMNNGGAAGSGSVKYKSTWPGTNAGSPNVGGQNQIWGTFAHTGGNQYDQSQTIDISKYDTVTFDVHANPGCPTNANGDICILNVAFWTVNYQVHGGTNVTIPTSATNGWYHVTALVNKSDNANLAAGWAFNINCYGGANSILYTNTSETDLWIDNIQVNASKVAPKPPTLSKTITSPRPGLNLFSGGPASDQYQRTNLKLNDTSGIPSMSDTTNGVEFAVTINSFPDPVAYGGYQAHIFISSGPASGSGFDYSDPNLLFLDIKENANGTGSGTFRYKTNLPNGNGFVYGAGTLGAAQSSTVLGTWKLKLDHGTNITVTGPDGTPFTTNITADAAALFPNPLSVAFGAQPNQPNNVGQVVILSRISITNYDNATSIVDDNFMTDTALDTSIWTIQTGEPNTLFLFPQDAGQKLVSWSLPDNGYGLQATTNISNPNSWTTLTGNEATGNPLVTFASSGSRLALVPSADLGPTQNYFRMFTRAFKKLQILLPGETAAPGTPTGKTGTPDQQTLGIPFNVVVNAVNDQWYLALTATDTIHLTTTDTTATLPADLPLSGGTITLSLTFNTAGTNTVTASDVTAPSIPSNTSPPVVNQ